MFNLKLVSKKFKEKNIINLKNLKIGKDLIIIAGPCSVESEKQILQTALEVKKAGANILRGGAFKPRTSPYSFQGLGIKGLKLLKKAGKMFDMPIITELIDIRDINLIGEYSDIIQIGARNMQNFPLLKEVGKTNKPIMLKRGMNSTLEEFLCAAEYIMKEGNNKVFLCERGIRTFETYTRNTLDLSIIPSIKKESNLPIFVDPSHGTGLLSHIEPMSLAAIAAGADGLMIEVHINPEKALSDGFQAYPANEFKTLVDKIKRLYLTLNKK
ncbi:hypothetical protein OSSY52_11500 [Tepiditoga spiralis]|uniref:DAHP synthetase I/KDSA domain-containing protein n=1 Tax=Tepiditoga spiralis TaxID=2108365 RepID=A0A7G1GBE2_9BACT|nr:3-deoxy-7-phosphoheptulonate synthase [Tepiditoga spiralis]BBE31009.1 hypothetical protein OSSY52_11500 [Tepiditoga spiralis]